MDGGKALLGSVIGPMTGVESVLEDDELLDGDEGRLPDEVVVNDDERELDERHRADEVVSEVAGLTTR